MAKVKTLSKGQIVIPAELRRKFNIRPGSELQIFEYGGIIYLIPSVEDPIEVACGSLPPQPSLAKQLLQDRQQEHLE